MYMHMHRTNRKQSNMDCVPLAVLMSVRTQVFSTYVHICILTKNTTWPLPVTQLTNKTELWSESGSEQSCCVYCCCTVCQCEEAGVHCVLRIWCIWNQFTSEYWQEQVCSPLAFEGLWWQHLAPCLQSVTHLHISNMIMVVVVVAGWNHNHIFFSDSGL